MDEGFCVWFTGLSASGKTTLSLMLRDVLIDRGLKVEILDGDVIRAELCKGLGFSRKDRTINIRRIGFVANLLVKHGVVVIVAAISPFQNVRDEIKEKIGCFIDVYVNSPLDKCISRDPKGLYRKAINGEIKNFTGITDLYEVPQNPDIEVRTDKAGKEECLERIIRTLEEKYLIPQA